MRTVVKREECGHWLPARSANPGGRLGVPREIWATSRELSSPLSSARANCWRVWTSALVGDLFEPVDILVTDRQLDGDMALLVE